MLNVGFLHNDLAHMINYRLVPSLFGYFGIPLSRVETMVNQWKPAPLDCLIAKPLPQAELDGCRSQSRPPNPVT
jgi:hypothetical protein